MAHVARAQTAGVSIARNSDSISERDSATSGRLWPKNPTLQNFDVVFNQKHFYLSHFWQQLGNSVVIAVAVGVITLFVATTSAFAISRLKVPGGRTSHWTVSAREPSNHKVIDRVVPLTEGIEAHRSMEERSFFGKIVIAP